jgi:hypothetical protein
MRAAKALASGASLTALRSRMSSKGSGVAIYSTPGEKKMPKATAAITQK